MNMNVITNFAALAERAHKASVDAGWYTNIETGERIQRNRGELFCLMHSEISEAMEGFRKALMDDKLPGRPMIEVELADFLIRLADYAGAFSMAKSIQMYAYATREVRGGTNVPERLTEVHACLSSAYWHLTENEERALGRAVLLVVQLADQLRLDLEGAIEDKMAYNATRADHKIENRKLANGKAF